MRLLLFLFFILLFDYYVFQAFETITSHWSATAKMTLKFLYWSISALLVIFLVAINIRPPEKWNKQFFTLFRGFLVIAYLSKFFIASLLLVDDFRRLILTVIYGNGPHLARSTLLAQIGIALGAIPFVLLNYGMLRNPYRYKVRRRSVLLNHLPESLNGLRIVQISDVHSGSFTAIEPVKKGIELINAQEADLVFFTGDLVNNQASEMQHFIDVFDKIEARHGVYSVLGNHDYGDYVRWESQAAKHQNLDDLKAIHQKMGWKLLLNEHRLLTINVKK